MHTLIHSHTHTHTHTHISDVGVEDPDLAIVAETGIKPMDSPSKVVDMSAVCVCVCVDVCVYVDR